ncbi:MAG: hypothetical protein LBU94_05485 [Clostridiales bacterium]|jgi:epoxyqueuosine reductase|nr:hypothetical protein [Clostridiales bacterium]
MNGIWDIADKYFSEAGAVFGVCGGGPLVVHENVDLMNVPFTAYDRDMRLNPEMTLKGVRSVIVVGLPVKNDVLKGLKGITAPTLSGYDYHRHVKNIIEGFVLRLKEYKDFNYIVQIDSGPLLERQYAVQAGLGLTGLNRNVIDPRLGSLFNIGLLLTDVDIPLRLFEAFRPGCENCKRCVDSCPTGALNNGFDYSLCRSYITQKKGVLTDRETDLLGPYVYGCDICLKACPYNDYERFLNPSDEKEICENLIGLLNMSKKEYDDLYKESNFYWRGRAVILRNALLCLGKRRLGYDEIKRFTLSESLVLAQTAENVIKKYFQED